MAERLIVLLREKAAEINVQILQLAVEPDHLRLFLDCPPDLAVSQIVFRLKAYSARRLRQEFEHLRRMPSIWTTSYLASTAGQVEDATIAKFINAQGTRD